MQQSSNDSCPRVSVVMPANRNDSFLDQSIGSILGQTFQDFEFIIIVDKWNRNLLEKITKKYGSDHRIRTIVTELGGFAFALNLGITYARGEYIARMDADDVSTKDRFIEQIEYLDRNQEISVLGCRVELIDSENLRVNHEFKYYETDTEIRRILPYRNPLPHPALMFRRTALLSVQGYKYGHSSEDHEMFLRMARDPDIKFHNLNKVLFQYRRHASQGTRPERMKWHFAENSGFMFTEFLLSNSPKYFLYMIVLHPWIRKMRLLFRKLLKGQAL